jgi:hypothetical protein
MIRLVNTSTRDEVKAQAETDAKDSFSVFSSAAIAVVDSIRTLPRVLKQLGERLEVLDEESDLALELRFRVASQTSALQESLDSFTAVLNAAKQAAGKQALKEIERGKAQRAEQVAANLRANADAAEQAENGRSLLREMFRK